MRHILTTMGCLLHHRWPCRSCDLIPGSWLDVETNTAVSPNGPHHLLTSYHWICRFLPPSQMDGSDRRVIAHKGKKRNMVLEVRGSNNTVYEELSCQSHDIHQVTRLRWLLTQNNPSSYAEVRHVLYQSAIAESYGLSANHRSFNQPGRRNSTPLWQDAKLFPHQAAAVSMQDRQRLQYDVCAREI